MLFIINDWQQLFAGHKRNHKIEAKDRAAENAKDNNTRLLLSRDLVIDCTFSTNCARKIASVVVFEETKCTA
jgi:hypothetical protein